MVNPNRFYTYAYLREDMTPYYIGKGKGNRLYRKYKGEVRPTKDKSKIIFLKQNLTEEEAFKHEIYMIAVLGRKDLGTGILRNKTDGGDGISGHKMTEESREKISSSNKGRVAPNKGRPMTDEQKMKISISMTGKNIGKQISEEHKNKLLNAWRGKKHTEESKLKMRNAKIGKLFSEERRRKMSGANNKKSVCWKITFADGKIIEKCGIHAWAKENGYDSSAISKMSFGKCKKHKNIVAVEKVSHPSCTKRTSVL